MHKATNKLLEYLDVIPTIHNKQQYITKAYNGIITLTGILNNPDKSVALIHFSNKEMYTDFHTHLKHETFIKISGEDIYFEIEGQGEKILTTSKPIYIPANIPHRLTKTDGEMHGIVILVPGSNTFPKGVING